MSTNPMSDSGTGKPYPRYLMDPEARKLLEQMEDSGLMVDVMAPAVGSVEVTVTAQDGSTHCILGRPEDLADTLKRAAALCGCDLSAVS